MKRPPIPAPLERAVLVESGHRCAIPTCRQVPVEIAHIVPWTTCKTHSFENLIALCPTCHTRYDNGEIDRKSMRIYKLNLQLLNSRYGDLEQRLIRRFAQNRSNDECWLMAEMEILVEYLLEDGILAASSETRIGSGGVVQKLYKLTKKGRDYVSQWPSQ